MTNDDPFARGEKNRNAILAVFYEHAAQGKPAPTFQEIQMAVKLHKTTVFNHLRTLVREGHLVHRPFKQRGYDLAESVLRQATLVAFEDWWERIGREIVHNNGLLTDPEITAQKVWMAARGLA